MTEPTALPARVRLTRLPGPPGMALLSQLERLARSDGGQDFGSRLAALGPERDCWVALAGGRPVALLLAEQSGPTQTHTLAVDPAWRGRGLEEALIQAAAEAP